MKNPDELPSGNRTGTVPIAGTKNYIDSSTHSGSLFQPAMLVYQSVLLLKKQPS